MDTPYDLLVIGSGSGARGVATRCRAAGWKVAVIDQRPLGGTCALRGCDPKRVMLAAAEALDRVLRLHGRGVTGEPHVDWAELMRRVHSFTDPFPARMERRFADAGIEAVRGVARFAGPRSLRVEGRMLEARHIVIAAGARPRPLGIPGAEHVVDSEAFLNLERLPARLVLIGGGYIAAEFSHLAARAGATCTILQRGPRLLPAFDPDLVASLSEKFAALGIAVHLDTTVEAVEPAPGGFRVRGARRGEPVTVDADLVVHAAGRVPDLDALELDAAEVARKDGRLVLNEFLQSASNPAVYATGDAAARGPALTPVASLDAAAVATNLLEGNRERPDYLGVPSVAFTLPAIARVGLGEQEASAQGLRFRTNSAASASWYTHRRVGETVAGHKVLIEEGTDRILGAHVLGTNADEVINLFALAIRNRLPAQALADTSYAYPTAASDLQYMVS
jgi:glutathione reductase (NADPH)